MTECPVARNYLVFSIIYTTVNFTRLSLTTEVGALYGRLICG